MFPAVGVLRSQPDASLLATSFWESMVADFIRGHPDILYKALQRVIDMECSTSLYRLLLLLEGVAAMLPSSSTCWDRRLPLHLPSSMPQLLKHGAMVLLKDAQGALGSWQHSSGLADMIRRQVIEALLGFIAASSCSSGGGGGEVPVFQPPLNWMERVLDDGVAPLWEQLELLLASNPVFSRVVPVINLDIIYTVQ